MEHKDLGVRSVNAVSIVFGLWLILAPFMFDYSANGGSVASDVIVGLLVFFSSVIKPNWFTGLLGIWLIAAPFVLGFPSGSVAMWNDIILGILVGGMALMSSTMDTPKDDDYDLS